jgi:F0F1-type ATP synthase assembly protein I
MSQSPEEDLVERMIGRHGEHAEDPVRDTIREYNQAIEELEQQHERELREAAEKAAEKSAEREGNIATSWGIAGGLIAGFFIVDVMNMDPFLMPIFAVLAFIAGILLGL